MIDNNIFISEEESKSINQSKIFNINIGVMGHVDSGKTSICKILTTIKSTASLDKNPQSKERGITMDLGFSSFLIKKYLKEEQFKDFEYIQFTLVDCPGHSSFIKSIISGSGIIDIVMLVIDISRGIQIQTAECIAIANIINKPGIIVFNKIDLIQESLINKKIDNILKVIKNNKYNQGNIDNIKYTICSANTIQSEIINKIKLDILNNCLNIVPNINRNNKDKLFYGLIDHCFNIKGKGVVLTCTILSGRVKVNEDIEISNIEEIKKVKGIQVFKRNVNKAEEGDRCGILVNSLDTSLIERGLIFQPKSIIKNDICIMKINIISYYKYQILSKSKFHITIGNQNIMGDLQLFTIKNNEEYNENNNYNCVDYITKSEISINGNITPFNNFNDQVYVLLKFQKKIYYEKNALLIGSRFDFSADTKDCRLAFYGNILKSFNNKTISDFNFYKIKRKEAIIEKQFKNNVFIVKGFAKKETKIDFYLGKNIITEDINNKIYNGIIDCKFGTTGKLKCNFEIDDINNIDINLFTDKKVYLYINKKIKI